jgi:hypothetical protein
VSGVSRAIALGAVTTSAVRWTADPVDGSKDLTQMKADERRWTRIKKFLAFFIRVNLRLSVVDFLASSSRTLLQVPNAIALAA